MCVTRKGNVHKTKVNEFRNTNEERVNNQAYVM